MEDKYLCPVQLVTKIYPPPPPLPFPSTPPCHVDHPTTAFGEKLREQVEERLTFFETGDTPRKNIDVMKEAIAEVESQKTKTETSEPWVTPSWSDEF